MDLKERVVLVTGSSDGIGKETAIEFAKEGAFVVVTYNSQKSKGKEVYDECKKLTKCMLCELNVTDEDSVKKCVEDVIDELGAIDILVNNAGIAIWKDFLELGWNEIEKQMEVNFYGVLRMTKKILPYMKGQNEGIILNVCSGAGKDGHPGLSVYSGTKFAVRGFMQALAEEINEGIKIYNINPHTTSTKMSGFKGTPPKKIAEIIVKTAKEKLRKKSGDDIDIWKYIKNESFR